MWRSSSSSARSLFRTLTGSSFGTTSCRPAKRSILPSLPRAILFCSSLSDSGSRSPSANAGAGGSGSAESITFAEAKRLMRLVNVESLKRKLERDGEEVIGYSQLLEACEGLGVARSREEAGAFARVLDEAGVILLFRDKVYLHPEKWWRVTTSLGSWVTIVDKEGEQRQEVRQRRRC